MYRRYRYEEKFRGIAGELSGSANSNLPDKISTGTLFFSAIALCLLAESFVLRSEGPAGWVFREALAFLHNPDTQWIAYLAIVIYYATFHVIRSSRKPATPDWLLTGILLIASLSY